jgi:NADPH2:quinone reductase
MNAATIRRYGPPSELVVEDVASPVPVFGKLVADVQSIGINPAYSRIRAGMFAHVFSGRFSKFIDYDGAGIIAASGPDVARSQDGSRILFGQSPQGERGAHATRSTASTANVAHVPGALDIAVGTARPPKGLLDCKWSRSIS